MYNNSIKCIFHGVETKWVEIIEGDEEAGIGRLKQGLGCSIVETDNFVEYWKDDDWMPKARII